jgi:uncharacterized protein (TIGR02444 family)
MNEAPSAFWNFSLRLYAQPGAAAACLELQDGAGADVNVLLYLLFLASQHRQLDDAGVAALDAAVAVWRAEVVRPLRAVRRFLKAPPPDFADEATTRLRDGIKRSELAAERIQQLLIERTFPADAVGATAASGEAAARANLAAYGKLLGGLAATEAAALERMIEIFIKQNT